MAISPEDLLADALEVRNTEAATALRDGRRMRAERGRAAVLSAAYELVNAGDNPTIAAIAERAGVSERTVFRYYPDREALMVGLAGELIVIIGPYIATDPPSGDIEVRLTDLLNRRVDLARIGGAFANAVDHSARDSQLARDLRILRREQLRAQTVAFLTPECEAAGATVLPAIHELLDYSAITSMLEDASEDDVRATLRASILRLLDL